MGTEGQWLQTNKALCQFLGYSQEELRGLTFQQLTWPEDLNKDLQQVEKLISGEINTYSMEKRYYNRNGDVVWALLAVSLVRHTDGTPLYFIAQIEDINELKRTEQVNQQLMERITLANEAGGIGIWEWELKPNIFSWDKRMFELYEIPPHIKPNWQVWYECVLPEDRQHAEKVIRDSLQSRSPFKLEFRITVKDGIRHIRALANRVLNKEGEVERLLGINMDMTEVKQLNEALFQEKERLHITLDSIGEAVVCIDMAMKITFMNPVAEEDERLDAGRSVRCSAPDGVAYYFWRQRTINGEHLQCRHLTFRDRARCGVALSERRQLRRALQYYAVKYSGRQQYWFGSGDSGRYRITQNAAPAELQRLP